MMVEKTAVMKVILLVVMLVEMKVDVMVEQWAERMVVMRVSSLELKMVASKDGMKAVS